MRETFLQMVRAEYWEMIEEGHLPAKGAATLDLLKSVDVALDDTSAPLFDFALLCKKAAPSQDDVFYDDVLEWLDRAGGQTMTAAAANLALDALLLDAQTQQQQQASSAAAAAAAATDSSSSTSSTTTTLSEAAATSATLPSSSEGESSASSSSFSSLSQPASSSPGSFSEDDLLRPATGSQQPPNPKNEEPVDVGRVCTRMVDLILSNGLGKRFVLDSRLYGKLVSALAATGQLDLAFQVLRTAER